MANRIKVHQIKPHRACTKTYSQYSSYKVYLRDDFNKRCGYCDDDDHFAGGKSGYQIDHHKPKSKFEELENDYSNLVYSCPFCNRAKWDKWKDNNGFIDPCAAQYDEHLHRNEKGQICHSSERGKYIFKELKLGLRRHEILWLIRKLETQREALDKYIQGMGHGHEKELEVLRTFHEIQGRISHYTQQFRDSI